MRLFIADVCGLVAFARIVIAGDVATLFPEPLKVGPFVAMPAGSEFLNEGVVTNRPLLCPSSRGEVKRDEMLAAQEVAEIRMLTAEE